MTKIKAMIAAAALLLCTFASATDFEGQRFNVRIGIAGAPGTAYDLFCENTGSDSWSLSGIYGKYHGDTKVVPPLTAEFSFSLASWAAVGLNLGYAAFSHDAYSALTNEVTAHRKGSVMYAMPVGTFRYYSHELIRLYGSFGFGLGIYSGFDNHGPGTKSRLEAQCIPIGVEFGRSIFGFAEAGFGTLYSGGRIGIGYKF